MAIRRGGNTAVCSVSTVGQRLMMADPFGRLMPNSSRNAWILMGRGGAVTHQTLAEAVQGRSGFLGSPVGFAPWR